MKALRYHGVQDLRLDEVPTPTYGADEALVRVRYAGICGSDLHVFGKGMFGIVPPMTMGHEFSGIIEAVGDQATGLRPGDLVVGDPRVVCGRCEWCRSGHENLCPSLGFIGEVRPGSFAQLIVLPAARLLRVKSHVDPLKAALIEPLAVAVHTVKLASIPSGATLGVVGAGPIGLLCMKLAKAQHSCRVIVVDPRVSRLEIARQLGADQTSCSLAEMKPSSADVVIEAAGKDLVFAGAITWVKPRGTVALVAIYENPATFDPTDAVAKEVILQGVNCYDRSDLEEAVYLTERDVLDLTPLVSHILPLDKGPEAFTRLLGGRDACKILLAPNLDP